MVLLADARPDVAFGLNQVLGVTDGEAAGHGTMVRVIAVRDRPGRRGKQPVRREQGKIGYPYMVRMAE